MKFSEIPYVRPSISGYEADFTSILEKFEQASSFDEQDHAFRQLYRLRDDFSTMTQLAEIKYTTDTSNAQYEKEVNFFGEAKPINEKLVMRYYRALSKATYKDQLKHKWGKHLFDLASFKTKGFDPAIIDSLQAQNKLASEYVKLKGTAKIEFEGQTLNLAGIGKYLVDKDRHTRKKAAQARWKFFADHQENIDDIYDRLVKLRHKMAVQLGYKDFTELGYIRMSRIDYNKDMVKGFRQQIADHIVPLTQRLRERQKNRLGYQQLFDYDLGFDFKSGNPTPKGTPQQILGKAQKMYAELSDETNTFFNYMLDNELLDVINRPGKADAGYCEEISNYKHPFIFANFNGTSGDIDVLTHEAGHAFQYFCSRQNQVAEYRWPSYEACEIHSMSMEFLTYPWMESFFEEDAQKYFFSHLNGSLLFLPYGCAVDHFQHVVYENPGFTPDERAQAWKEMEAIYLPDYKYENNPYLSSGRFWQRQGHIFEDPFYYIDYVLAQVCAYQFWQKGEQNRTKAWSDYVRLCKAGGTAPFLELVKLADLRSPFEKGCVQNLAGAIEQYLGKIDDSKF